MNGKLAGARVVDLRADQIGGQQVRRELDAGKAGLNGLSHRLDQQRFSQTGHPFQQDMAIGQQRD